MRDPAMRAVERGTGIGYLFLLDSIAITGSTP
jgi:hypothetical protein